MARALIKYAAMFKDRHYFPVFVKDYVYDGSAKGYDPMDIMRFRQEAIEKFIKWKHEGFTCAHIYMSGLGTAIVSLINASCMAELPIRLYHYSFLQDKWLPQSVDFCKHLGYNDNITERELNDSIKEIEMKADLEKGEYMNLIGYVRIYKDILLKYKDAEELPEWKELRTDLFQQYKDLHSHILEIMADHLYPRQHLVGGETFNERLKQQIILDREVSSVSYNNLDRGSAKNRRGYTTRNSPRPVNKGATYKREHKHRNFRRPY